jgi:hypothetical protein
MPHPRTYYLRHLKGSGPSVSDGCMRGVRPLRLPPVDGSGRGLLAASPMSVRVRLPHTARVDDNAGLRPVPWAHSIRSRYIVAATPRGCTFSRPSRPFLLAINAFPLRESWLQPSMMHVRLFAPCLMQNSLSNDMIRLIFVTTAFYHFAMP